MNLLLKAQNSLSLQGVNKISHDFVVEVQEIVNDSNLNNLTVGKFFEAKLSNFSSQTLLKGNYTLGSFIWESPQEGSSALYLDSRFLIKDSTRITAQQVVFMQPFVSSGFVDLDAEKLNFLSAFVARQLSAKGRSFESLEKINVNQNISLEFNLCSNDGEIFSGGYANLTCDIVQKPGGSIVGSRGLLVNFFQKLQSGNFVSEMSSLSLNLLLPENYQGKPSDVQVNANLAAKSLSISCSDPGLSAVSLLLSGGYLIDGPVIFNVSLLHSTRLKGSYNYADNLEVYARNFYLLDKSELLAQNLELKVEETFENYGNISVNNYTSFSSENFRNFAFLSLGVSSSISATIIETTDASTFLAPNGSLAIKQVLANNWDLKGKYQASSVKIIAQDYFKCAGNILIARGLSISANSIDNLCQISSVELLTKVELRAQKQINNQRNIQGAEIYLESILLMNEKSGSFVANFVNISLNGSAQFTNKGGVFSKEALNLRATDFINMGAIRSDGKIDLEVASSVRNSGKISSTDQLRIIMLSNGEVHNAQNSIISSENGLVVENNEGGKISLLRNFAGTISISNGNSSVKISALENLALFGNIEKIMDYYICVKSKEVRQVRAAFFTVEGSYLLLNLDKIKNDQSLIVFGSKDVHTNISQTVENLSVALRKTIYCYHQKVVGKSYCRATRWNYEHRASPDGKFCLQEPFSYYDNEVTKWGAQSNWIDDRQWIRLDNQDFIYATIPSKIVLANAQGNIGAIANVEVSALASVNLAQLRGQFNAITDSAQNSLSNPVSQGLDGSSLDQLIADLASRNLGVAFLPSGHEAKLAREINLLE